MKGEDPYAAFEPEEVESACVEMRLDGIAKALGREVSDPDVLVWLRSRRALPRVGNCTTHRDGDRLCIQDSDGGELWLSRVAAVDLCRDLMRLLIEGT